MIKKKWNVSRLLMQSCLENIFSKLSLKMSYRVKSALFVMLLLLLGYKKLANEPLAMPEDGWYVTSDLVNFIKFICHLTQEILDGLRLLKYFKTKKTAHNQKKMMIKIKCKKIQRTEERGISCPLQVLKVFQNTSRVESHSREQGLLQRICATRVQTDGIASI